ncbi:oligosaccharide flippase family protein [Clostridium beijerinckii]|uniref:Polysaccharide biosynthesis protein n=1 Tax=Clostridium beijerinckii TaxID=1520 RepID=A0A7X9XP01_CLOBE|nr:oligosaccharide flippase family protein [Clostridium beijerinckii]NMF04834.1 polysaccharide biosynthesis protein [Clostridium beijerinckii]
MNLIKKFVEFAIGNGIVLILGFISTPLITRIINPNEMGKYSMFDTITNLLILLASLGIDQSYVRYYYDEGKFNRGKLLRKCIGIAIIVSIAIATIVLILYKPISIYIVEEKSLLIVVLLIINLLVGIFARFSMLQIRMRQRGKLYSFLSILLKASYLLLVPLFFFIYDNNYKTIVMAIIISNIIVSITAIFMEREEWFKFKTSKELKTSASEILRYGVPLLFSASVIWIFQSIDRMSIKYFCGAFELGLYSGAMSIIALLNAVQVAFTTFWVPVAYERYSINPENKEFFSKVNKIISVVMLLMAIGLIATKDIIVLLLGEKYRQAAFIFPYLVFMPMMYTISETTVLGINFKKKTKNHIYIATISAVFNIICNFLLVPKYGAIGAAVSTGLAYIVFFATRTFISNLYYKVNYNIGRFSICTIITYILATYSSFHKFNIVILVLTIISVSVIGILYRDIFTECLNLLKSKFKEKAKREFTSKL